MSQNKQQKNNFLFIEAFEVLTTDLPDRSRSILRDRYGIGTNDQRTLEAIGQKHGVTRERVRQIVVGGVDSVRAKKNEQMYGSADTCIRCAVENKSGIIKEEDLLHDLSKQQVQDVGAIRFFIMCSEEVDYLNEKKLPVETTVALVDLDMKKWEDIHRQALELLENEDKTIELDLFQEKLTDVSSKEVEDYLRVSREIQENPFGKWGIYSWDDIALKGIREKVYTVLQESNEPLHFREIAKRIDAYGLSKKGRKAHPQTVHNELIKDDRFVLIGRGTYALAAWGYETGTVKDVVTEVLNKEEKPLQKEEIVKRVLAVRKVKPTTVMINLHNHFERVGNDEYQVRK